MSVSGSPPEFRCALITGASSGLGLEYARQLAPRVETLVLVARRENLLEEIATDLVTEFPRLRVKVFASDLVDDAGRNHLINALSQADLYPDCLINNAGMGDYGEFRTSDWSKIEQMIRLNMEALTHLTHALLPGLMARRGAILNVSSLASVLPIPDFAVYAATKSYVTSFSEALRLELRDQGVRILAVCPGPVKTGFGEVARRGNDGKLPVQESFYVSADKVVRNSIKALLLDRPRIYPGLKVATAAAIIGLLPIAAVRLIMGRRPRRSD
ncbi:SDR family oxidoreductase [Akkermansiaceae bacterium]|jgi:short-subunit dehydrogenase|nr:SDR family oxidoreductase [Akkermansiaceae bacterium]